jgi:hypothetical protein
LGTKYLISLNLDQNLEENRNKKMLSNIDKTNNQWSKQSDMYNSRTEVYCYKKIAKKRRVWFLLLKILQCQIYEESRLSVMLDT